jgi:dTDP-4-amino-4,6-dideoxygalactose transaminase
MSYETFQEKLKVMESGWYILGNEVREFESSFANYCNFVLGREMVLMR